MLIISLYFDFANYILNMQAKTSEIVLKGSDLTNCCSQLLQSQKQCRVLLGDLDGLTVQVILTRYKEFIFRNFHDFYQTIVWRTPEDKARCLKLLTEGIVKLIAVTVTALHHFLIVISSCCCQEPRFNLDG